MAMSPSYVNAQLLFAAIDKATSALGAPIDRIEVFSRKILFWTLHKIRFRAGSRRFTISYRYVADTGGSLGASASLFLDGEETAVLTPAPWAERTVLPTWERRRVLLNAAITKATRSFNDAPIVYVEVTSDKILFRSNTKELAISYQYVERPVGRMTSREYLLDGQDYWECFKG